MGHYSDYFNEITTAMVIAVTAISVLSILW